MNNSQQETSVDTNETAFGGSAESKQRRIIYFSSGETLEEEDGEEEEEQPSDSSLCSEPAEKTGFSFKKVAFIVGRISLLTCDFLGERLAAALGLKAAKYQYAIDQYHREHKTTSTQAADSLREGPAEMIHLSSVWDRSHYGTCGDAKCSYQDSTEEKHMKGSEGYRNRGYQTD